MAGEAKFGKKAAEEVIDLLKQAKSGDQLETLATKTGFDVEVLDDVVQKGIGKGGAKGGKDLLKSVVEKLGGTIENVQAEVNTLLGRTRDVSGGQVPPSAKGMVETTGPVDAAKGKGFTITPSVGPAGEAPPAIVKPSGLPKPGEVITPEVVEPGRLPALQSKVRKGTIDAEVVPGRLALPPGQAEVPPPAVMSQTPTQRALEAATAPKPPQQTPVPKKSAAAAVGLGVAGLGAGFSQEANAPTTIKASQVDKVQDLSPAINKAVNQGAVTPEQKSVLENQAEQLEIAAQSLEQKLTTDYEKKKARVELMQLAETVMSGLVTAIGANALLNRGSPYAVDFSKGPKTDWAGEFDRLQKDYATQMGAIMQKYKLEAAEKREAERAATQKSQFQQSQALKREAMGIREKQAQVAQATQEAAKGENLQAKLAGTLEKITAPEITPAALISQAGMLNTQARQLLGEAGYAELKKEAAKIAKEDAGIFEKGWNAILSLVGKDAGKETKAEHKRRVEAMATLLQKKLEEGIPTAPAAPAAAPVDADRALLEELRARKAAQQKGG